MIDPGEAAARAFYNAASGSYPATEATPAPAPPASPQAAPRAAEAVGAPPVPATPSYGAEDLYTPPVRGFVDWSEPVAAAADFDLQARPGVLDTSEAGMAALARLRDGFAAAGAGVSVARELFQDAIRAHDNPGSVPGREQAEAELRQHFGARYDEKIAAAAGLVRRAAAHCPEIVPFLERTGLGNSPEFIRKLVAAAGRRGGG